MLTDDKYEALAFSILDSSDPILLMLETERDFLSENPNLWQNISKVLYKAKEDKKLDKLQIKRFDSILKTIKVFQASKWERDEKIPSDLFNMGHLFFFVFSGKDVFDHPKDKILVGLGYEFTLNVMEGLRPFNLSKEEYVFFKGAFNGRFPARDYCDELDKGTSVTLDKIFQRPKGLRTELQDYYFTNIKADILDFLSKRKDLQVDFQIDFDNRMKSENEPEFSRRQNSGLRLNRSMSGVKIDLLRVLDALYDLRFFTNDEGQLPTKEFVMKAFGEFLGDDFSAFANSLSQSYHNTSLETNLLIFEQLKAKIQEKHLSKT